MRSNIERRYTYGHWVYSENSGAPSLGLFDLELTYDANSAIKTLKRTGKQNTSGTYGIIDDLTYSYSGGRLQDVTDHAAKTVYDGAFNFMGNTINTHGGAPDYAYNANGAMTRDFNKGITFITYNMFGYPQKVIFANRNSIEYVYSADGIRLKTRRIRAVPQSGAGSSSSSTTNYTFYRDSIDYVGDFEYNRNHFSKYKWENGYVQPQGTSYAYSFYFKDHQGNNRVVTPHTGFVRQTLHYYPDGVTQDKSVLPSVQKNKYNGKELDRMHGLDWYDYGARQYDPTIGQFTSMDPLCEKYYHISPYAYCAGNPVRYVDPDGRKVYLFSTKLPGANYVPFATHTFLAIQQSNGKITYAAYGAQNNDCLSGNDVLVRCSYQDDWKAISDFVGLNKISSHVKDIDLIPVPKGMNSDEFDEKVIETINSFGNNIGINYNLNPTEETNGNCNSSTSTILLLSGVPKETIDEIGNRMQGLNWGFSSNPKPWTSAEQKKAVADKNKSSKETTMRLDALQKAL